MKVSVRQFNVAFNKAYPNKQGEALIEQYKTAFNAYYGSGTFKDYYVREYMTMADIARNRLKRELEHGIRLPVIDTPLCSMIDTFGKMDVEVNI